MKPLCPDYCSTTNERRTIRGFSMIEVAIATAVLGMVAAAALHVVGLNAKRAAAATERVRAHELADLLMHEILSRPFLDPEDEGAFGLDSGELFGKRAGFDDVNDYNNYIEMVPTDVYDAKLNVPGTWSRTVAVTPIDPWTMANTTGPEIGLVRVTVLVFNQNREVVRLIAYRSLAGDTLVNGALAEFIGADGSPAIAPVDRTRLLDEVEKAIAQVAP